MVRPKRKKQLAEWWKWLVEMKYISTTEFRILVENGNPMVQRNVPSKVLGHLKVVAEKETPPMFPAPNLLSPASSSSPLPPAVKLGRAGPTPPSSSPQSPQLPLSGSTSKSLPPAAASQPLPPAVTLGRAGQPPLIQSKEDLLTVAALRDFNRTRVSELGFEKDTYQVIEGGEFAEDPRIGGKLVHGNETAANEFFRALERGKVDELLFRKGRAPTAWSLSGGGKHWPLSAKHLDQAAIDKIIEGLEFDDLHRAAFSGRLHRVSVVKSGIAPTQVNIRIGRVISGPAWAFADVLAEDRSVVFVGPPARGKSTLIRDICRLLQDVAPGRKIALIDRSDELGGSSDTAHPCLGEHVQVVRLKKMTPAKAITLAFRNLSPAVLIVGEIATAEEADALLAAKRAGVTVIATCHGDMPHAERAGRKIAVSTIGDAAAAEGDQFRKVKEERQEPPVFDTLVEVEAHTQWAIYHDLEAAIDALLNKEKEHTVELRGVTSDGVLVNWYEVRDFSRPNSRMRAHGRAAAVARKEAVEHELLRRMACIAQESGELGGGKGVGRLEITKASTMAKGKNVPAEAPPPGGETPWGGAETDELRLAAYARRCPPVSWSEYLADVDAALTKAPEQMMSSDKRRYDFLLKNKTRAVEYLAMQAAVQEQAYQRAALAFAEEKTLQCAWQASEGAMGMYSSGWTATMKTHGKRSLETGLSSADSTPTKKQRPLAPAPVRLPPGSAPKVPPPGGKTPGGGATPPHQMRTAYTMTPHRTCRHRRPQQSMSQLRTFRPKTRRSGKFLRSLRERHRIRSAKCPESYAKSRYISSAVHFMEMDKRTHELTSTPPARMAIWMAGDEIFVYEVLGYPDGMYVAFEIARFRIPVAMRADTVGVAAEAIGWFSAVMKRIEKLKRTMDADKAKSE
ncbi:hypothetical protein HDU89_000425 [Geranomyces variabilis]|nr:hypothetical protein HDU89_000425 [Geranomyces variabilis]